MNVDELRDALDELAGSAEAPADSIVASLHRRARRSRRLRRGVSIGSLVAVAIAVAVVFVAATDPSTSVRVQTPPSSATTTPTGKGPTATLRIPRIGRARAARLSDGTPVWVVHHDDGSVTVLSAVSTHAPNGIHQLAAWCAEGRNFEDGMYGSMWNEHGDVIGGPAPTGLPVAKTRRIAGDLVEVESPRGSGSDRSLASSAGIVTCFSNPPMGFDGGLNKVLSAFERNPKTIAEVAVEANRGITSNVEYVPAAALVVTPDLAVRLRAATATPQESVCTDGPLVTGIDAAGLQAMHPGAFQVVRGNLLLRTHTGTIELVAFTRGGVLDMFTPSS